MKLTSRSANIRAERTNRFRRATTLVEMLVVIVILLVGILAVLQIFPRGFQILVLARKNAQATALARDEAERLKAMSDGIPEQILPLRFGGTEEVTLPSDLGPAGQVLLADGTLEDGGGNNLGNWQINTAANRYRRIVGEAHSLTAPRRVGLAGTEFGSLVIPTFAPVDTNHPIFVNGNELAREAAIPEDLTQRGVTDLFDTRATLGDFVFVMGGAAAEQYVYLPTGLTDRGYTLAMTALVNHNGQLVRRTFRNIPVAVLAATPGADTGEYPLFRVSTAAAVATQLSGGDTVGSVLPESVRVYRAFNNVVNFSADPFEYRILDAGRGLFLFNPAAYSEYASIGGRRVPIRCSFDYSVADWRILRSDFRLSEADRSQYQLPIGNLRTHTQPGADGRIQPGFDTFDATDASQAVNASFLTLMDLDTGGTIVERDPGNAADQYVTVDKSLGVIRFRDLDAAAPRTQVDVRLPDGNIRRFDVEGRAIRALYQGRDEWSVQVLKPATTYRQTTDQPVAGEFYVGGSNGVVGGLATRIYFPPMDAGQKVTIDEIYYLDGGLRKSVRGQDFVIRYRNDGLNLPSIDLADVVASASGFDFNAAPAVRNVRGASLTVRSLYNPEFFSLGSNSATNLASLERWGRGWRKSTVQTYLQPGEDAR